MNRRGEESRRVDQPEPGYFEMRMVRHGPFVAAKITHEDGVWGAWIDGVPCGDMNVDPVLADGVFRVWLVGRRIDKAAYDYRLALKTWALAQPQADHPAANPRKPIDLRTRAPLF